ncbi:hypothetical protein MRX96_046315, partial [Rhipicephalus microplus]
QTILQKKTAHLLLLFLWSRGHPDSGPGLIRPAHFQSRGPSHGPIHCPYHGHFLDPGFGLSQSSTLYKQTILQKKTAHLLLLFLWSRGHPDSGPGLIRPAHFQSRGPSHGPIHCPYHGHFLDPGFGLSQSSTLYKPCRKRRLLYRGSAELAAKWWLDLTETGAFLGPIQL